MILSSGKFSTQMYSNGILYPLAIRRKWGLVPSAMLKNVSSNTVRQQMINLL